jgi:hypothetical protein
VEYFRRILTLAGRDETALCMSFGVLIAGLMGAEVPTRTQSLHCHFYQYSPTLNPTSLINAGGAGD